MELQPDQAWLCSCRASWLLVPQGGALQKAMLRRCWHQHLSGELHLLQALGHDCEIRDYPEKKVLRNQGCSGVIQPAWCWEREP